MPLKRPSRGSPQTLPWEASDRGYLDAPKREDWREAQPDELARSQAASTSQRLDLPENRPAERGGLRNSKHLKIEANLRIGDRISD